MNFDRIEITKESPQKPEKLFRAFTVHPEELSLEKLREGLVPGNVNKDDPTKIGDGNELGVYMSTNPAMVESAYAAGGYSIEGSAIEVPRHNSANGSTNIIRLPMCGVVYEIDTADLAIRKPEITPALQGVHNNGFEGDEWIADKVPADNCTVKKLILSEYANDRNRMEVDVSGLDDEKFQTAIELVKEKFAKKKAEALKFKEFLESLPEKERFKDARLLKMQ